MKNGLLDVSKYLNVESKQLEALLTMSEKVRLQLEQNARRGIFSSMLK
ncbi:MAG: hypothetical protein KBT36_14385 [Kurthia sp.]|nr:hypothetical protein [Candidatus Kurthia equi]